MSYPPPYDPHQAQPPQYGAPTPHPQSYPPAAPYGQPVPPPKKSSTGKTIGIIVGVVLLLVCLVCGGGAFWFYNKASDKVQELQDTFPTTLPSIGTDTNGAHSVKLSVTGSGKALITWSKGVGGTSSDTVSLPWSKEIDIDANTFSATVFALGQDDATLEGCTIEVDGKEKKKNTSSGTSVTCIVIFTG